MEDFLTKILEKCLSKFTEEFWKPSIHGFHKINLGECLKKFVNVKDFQRARSRGICKGCHTNLEATPKSFWRNYWRKNLEEIPRGDFKRPKKIQERIYGILFERICKEFVNETFEEFLKKKSWNILEKNLFTKKNF